MVSCSHPGDEEVRYPSIWFPVGELEPSRLTKLVGGNIVAADDQLFISEGLGGATRVDKGNSIDEN